MNIVVCIKQVPDTESVQVDSKTGVLIRDGIETKMNPYDLYALETALRIKAETNAVIHVITMGPPNAQAVIEEAFALGADEGYLMSDRRFGGADVLATAYTLSQGISSILEEVDLILCGKQTIDGDTAQVGPAIAEYLSIPHVSWVKKILSFNEYGIEMLQELVDHSVHVRMNYPCLITVEKGIYQPGLPSYRKKQASLERQIHWITLDQCLDLDPSRYGLSGSPTQVERIFEPAGCENGERFDFDTIINAKKIIEKFKEMKVFREEE